MSDTKASLSVLVLYVYIEFIIFQVQFETNEKFVLDGSFSCNIDDYIDKSLIDILETGKPEYFKFDSKPNRIVELKNKNILVSSCRYDLLALHDSELKLIRTIKEINNEEIQPFGLACDQNGNIYFTNVRDHSLFKLDSELKSIQSIKCGCYDITIYKDKIYAFNILDKCIRVYSLDLDLISEQHFKDDR